MIKQLIKGVATFIPGLYPIFSKKRTGGTESARYCYSVWLRHLVMAHTSGLQTKPIVIAELGPGDSIGIGLAALITSADKYYALDVVKYADVKKNLEIFDELIELFQSKEDIPGEKEWPKVIPRLKSYAFPDYILDSGYLNNVLDKHRINRIRRSIENVKEDNSMIHYKVPWFNLSVIEPESVDMIFSQAVLEHVDDLANTYTKMYSWLKPKGFMSHAIDFKCHGYADDWNGHWVYSDFVWKLIKGKRLYLINREPFSRHIEYLNVAGFNVVCSEIERSSSRIKKNMLSPRFKNISEEDLVISTAFIQAVKQQRPVRKQC